MLKGLKMCGRGYLLVVSLFFSVTLFPPVCTEDVPADSTLAATVGQDVAQTTGGMSDHTMPSTTTDAAITTPFVTTAAPNVALIAGVTVGVSVGCLICILCIVFVCTCCRRILFLCSMKMSRRRRNANCIESIEECPHRSSHVNNYGSITDYRYLVEHADSDDIRQRQPGHEEQSSTSYQTASLRAKVPFLYHNVLECSSDGCELVIADHDITITVPKGAVTEGERMFLEVGVAMFGPFKFTNNSQPISPILWLCFLDEDFVLKKPIRVTLPHFLKGIARSDLHDHHVAFSKANHRHSHLEDGSIFYTFKPIEGNFTADFTSSGDNSCGVLETYHCCFLCIEAKKTPQLLTDATYFLVRIESSCPPRSEVHFATTYFLETCLKALEDQYSEKNGFKIVRYTEFKFKHCEHVEPQHYTPLKITVHGDERSYVLGLEPANAEIYPNEIDFWKEKFDDMLLRHKTMTYPPRVIMTVEVRTSVAVSISVTFSGCENSHKLDATLMFPLEATKPVPKSSHSEDVEEEVNLRVAFSKLLPLAHKWKSIATFLNVPESVLNKVAQDEKTVDDCLRAVLAYRIHNMDRPLTWFQLADATDPFDKSKANELRAIANTKSANTSTRNSRPRRV